MKMFLHDCPSAEIWKALLESGSKGGSDAVSKTVWISDRMNEWANLNMPALLPGLAPFMMWYPRATLDEMVD